MTLRDLLPPDSTDDEDRCRMSATDNETDQINGLGVTPLQIVDDQQTRAVASHDGSAYSIKQPMALSHVARLFRSSWLRNVAEFGQETSELCPPDRLERGEVASDSLRSEQVDDRTPRQSTRSLVRTSRCYRVSVCSNPTAEFQCETGLSDTRFPGHQEDMCPILPRGVPCLDELVPFEVAADERRFGDG